MDRGDSPLKVRTATVFSILRHCLELQGSLLLHNPYWVSTLALLTSGGQWFTNSHLNCMYTYIHTCTHFNLQHFIPSFSFPILFQQPLETSCQSCKSKQGITVGAFQTSHFLTPSGFLFKLSTDGIAAITQISQGDWLWTKPRFALGDYIFLNKHCYNRCKDSFPTCYQGNKALQLNNHDGKSQNHWIAWIGRDLKDWRTIGWLGWKETQRL